MHCLNECTHFVAGKCLVHSKSRWSGGHAQLHHRNGRRKAGNCAKHVLLIPAQPKSRKCFHRDYPSTAIFIDLRKPSFDSQRADHAEREEPEAGKRLALQSQAASGMEGAADGAAKCPIRVFATRED